MDVQDLSKMLCDSLQSHTVIKIEIDSSIYITGDNLEEISRGLQEKDTIIHKAGTYILGNEIEVLYIGEGGPSKTGDGGTMGHRVYQHLDKKGWGSEIRKIIFVPMYPREFSKLGEQEALAIHFQIEGILPKYQQIWR